MQSARYLYNVEVVARAERPRHHDPPVTRVPPARPVTSEGRTPPVVRDAEDLAREPPWHPQGGSVVVIVEFRVVLTVPDFDEAVAFYRDGLGLEQLADWSGDDGRVILLDAGRGTIELFDERQAESVDRIEAGRRVSGPVRLAFEVDDLDATAQRLVEGGAASEAPPVVPPWGGLNLRLRAPDGMQLTLFSEA
jgi:lactoylglutathione lyase